MAYRSFGRFRQASTHLDTPPFSQNHHPVSAIARRRLAKDWENLNHTALAFLRLASIRMMLRKLCNPS